MAALKFSEMINRITAREHQPAAGNLSDKKTLATVAPPIKRRYTKHRPDRQAGYGKNKRIARQHIISVSLIRAMTVGDQFLQFKYSSVETVKCRIASKGTACRIFAIGELPTPPQFVIGIAAASQKTENRHTNKKGNA